MLEEAARQGITLRALTRRDQNPRDGISWVRGDLHDTGALAELVKGADAVLHIAGVVNTPDPMGFHVGNVEGTEQLVAAARAAGVNRFVFVSSLSAREPGLSVYGKSKRHAEEVVQTSGLDWTIIRPPAIYGPRDKEILELFRAARWGVVPMPPAGRASVIHVHDLARLLLAVAPPQPAAAQRIFEVDDGRPGGWSHRELATAIGRAMGRKVWVPHLPKVLLLAAARLDTLFRNGRAKLTADRVGYMAHPDWVCRPEQVPPESIWQAREDTEAGLAATARWYRQQGWL
ncbi:nucleoside-diphosphate-sugar epimerase [Altererythrobacter atlanticus]|uniref:3 beta-hydroxysteroid dehydrogenase/Delta 5-->4-isomerase n=1 Tax=Croceibacterium atlanticum TaxID=1267766 RepID=A0A0F7KTA8_9SPHN|nr:3 beta-hydroxysteroid dehydrogenase/Delta 5-->4-isomerase [Croceibacterium atlanticum]MBB5731148.1 nucleoside-diphosphate-sugar epimerase [Croceibacterium atlanticum]